MNRPKEQGFILISMLLLGMMMSLLGLSSLAQSRLAAHFTANMVSRLSLQEAADMALHQAEQNISSTPIMGVVPNSWNYLDHGGAVIHRIQLEVGSKAQPQQLQLEAIYWQRQLNQSQDVHTFLTKAGQLYRVSVQNQPAELEFSSGKTLKIIPFPQTVTELGAPLLVDSSQLHYADWFFIADNHHEVWQLNLTQVNKGWAIKPIIMLSAPAKLTIGLWAAPTEDDDIELYIATDRGIEAWTLGDKAKLAWKTSRPVVNFFLEGRRLWWIDHAGFNQLKLGAIDRFNGQDLSAPLFIDSPGQATVEFTPHNTDYSWRLSPDTLKKTETLCIAGASILLYPPEYEMGVQKSFSQDP
ncbi:MAG: hypothetical protein Q7V63_02655 [Gammaproteobacteria bacterium]|nr:hypothetical protein [Gammaproteobacteria bacterium]